MGGAQSTQSVDDVVRQCQYLAGSAIDSSTAELGRSIRRLAYQIQTDLSPRDQFVVQQVFVRTIVRAAKTAGAEGRPDVRNAIARYLIDDASAVPWHKNVERLATSCARALERSGADRAPLDTDRIKQMLAAIGEHFASPTMSLALVAASSGVSCWHAARLLKNATGLTFTQHLHRARIRATGRLLTQTTLSMKEIASIVGYTSASRLGRLFRRIEGTTPRAFRRTAVTLIARTDHK